MKHSELIRKLKKAGCLLKRHGAFIAVDANEPQGSVFTITFPKDGSADGEKRLRRKQLSLSLKTS